MNVQCGPIFEPRFKTGDKFRLKRHNHTILISHVANGKYYYYTINNGAQSYITSINVSMPVWEAYVLENFDQVIAIEGFEI